MRTKYPDFEDTYQTHPAPLSCGPCNCDCGQGRACPARAPAEACTEVGHTEPRGKWAPLINVLAICWGWLTGR